MFFKPLRANVDVAAAVVFHLFDCADGPEDTRTLEATLSAIHGSCVAPPAVLTHAAFVLQQLKDVEEGGALLRTPVRVCEL